MQINLTPEEESFVLEVAGNMATTKNITPEQAIKDLLAMGCNAWREMEFVARLTAKSKEGRD